MPVDGGVAVLDPRFPASYEHNTLWIVGPADAVTVAAEAERVLGGVGLTHRQVVLDDPVTAGALASRGWGVQELCLMVCVGTPVVSRSLRVVPVAHEIIGGLWERSWRRDLPDVDDETVRQLVGREPIASAQVRIDGATAAIEAVMTDPAHQRAGLARALVLVLNAVARARAAGCDVVFLVAAADDWPRGWYARLGFVDVGTRFEATRPAIRRPGR